VEEVFEELDGGEVRKRVSVEAAVRGHEDLYDEIVFLLEDMCSGLGQGGGMEDGVGEAVDPPASGEAGLVAPYEGEEEEEDDGWLGALGATVVDVDDGGEEEEEEEDEGWLGALGMTVVDVDDGDDQLSDPSPNCVQTDDEQDLVGPPELWVDFHDDTMAALEAMEVWMGVETRRRKLHPPPHRDLVDMPADPGLPADEAPPVPAPAPARPEDEGLLADLGRLASTSWRAVGRWFDENRL